MIKRQLPAGGNIAVTICDRTHAHYGEHGTLTGDLITFKPTGETMALVKLENCLHGVDACYVTKGQVRERAV